MNTSPNEWWKIFLPQRSLNLMHKEVHFAWCPQWHKQLLFYKNNPVSQLLFSIFSACAVVSYLEPCCFWTQREKYKKYCCCSKKGNTFFKWISEPVGLLLNQSEWAQEIRPITLSLSTLNSFWVPTECKAPKYSWGRSFERQLSEKFPCLVPSYFWSMMLQQFFSNILCLLQLVFVSW